MSLLVIAATPQELTGVPPGMRVVCGIGPAAASMATADAVQRFRPSCILNVGIAGARRASGIPMLATVIGGRAVDCDDGLPEISPRAELLGAVSRVLPDAPVLPIGTSSRVGGTDAVQVEAMEGHRVLAAAAAAGIPAVEVRVISNEIEEPDRTYWRFDEAFAELDRVCALLCTALA